MLLFIATPTSLEYVMLLYVMRSDHGRVHILRHRQFHQIAKAKCNTVLLVGHKLFHNI